MIRHWYLWFIFLAVVIWLSPCSTVKHSASMMFDKPGWTLIFDDEFDGTTLNTAVWEPCIPWWDPNNCTTEDNSELELYLPDNAYMDGSGHLMLKVEKKDVGGRNYVSGMVDSYNSFSFQYGYAEARLKVPAGNGFWPAFWMLPVNDGPWPRDEIDVMENLGYNPIAAYFTYHWPSGDTTQQIGHHITGPDFSEGWHTFAVDWEPSAIIWYVDGVERARYTEVDNITSKPMFVILNLAIGSEDSWPGPPDDTTPFPSYFQVDYVRVWQPSSAVSLSLSKSVFPSHPITPGSPITYQVFYQNYSDVTNTGVRITDVIPSYLHDITYLSYGAPITLTGNIPYTWLVEDLAPGDGGLISISGIVNTNLPTGFVFTNTASITSTIPETNTADNTSWTVTTIANAPPMAPLVDAGPDQTADEGAQLDFTGIITDVDDTTFTVTWNFGDNTTLTGTLTPTHTFLNDGIYTVTLTASDDEGGVGRDVLLVTVANVAPTLNSLDDVTATAELPVTITITFSDPGLLDLHTVTILWSDDISETLELTAGRFDLSVSHVFLEPGSYTVNVTVTDNFGSGNSGQFRLIVVPASYKIYLPFFFSGKLSQ
jgi:uncharacterized repeat protein (TIGR01451 family)